jgi:hypothetical protein
MRDASLGLPSDIGPRKLDVLFIVAALGTIIRLALVWSGCCDAYVIADDAYYYFTIARNIALGHGATFDGLSPTNGFHPLHLLALVPVWSISLALHAGYWLPIRLALTLCVGLDLITGILLYRLLVRIGLPRAAPWASGFWFLSPLPVLITLRGLEASLSALLATCTAFLAIQVFSLARPSLRLTALLGVSLGLAGLARTDNWPLLGCALAAMAIGAWWHDRWPVARAVLVLLVLGCVAAAVAMPWFLWSQLVFGSPWQVSGAAKLSNPLIYGHLTSTATRVHLPGFVTNLLRLSLTPLRFVLGEEFAQPKVSAWAGACLACAGMVSLAALRGLARWPMVARLAALGAATFLLGHLVVYAMVFRSYVPWYAAVPLLILATWFGICVAEVSQRNLSPWLSRVIALLCVMIVLTSYARFFAINRIVPGGEERVLAPTLAFITREYPRVRTIGSFDAGALGYFAPKYGSYRVVNLDGLVNNRAYDAWRSGDYYGYLIRTIDLFWVNSNEMDVWLTPPEKARILAHYPQWGEWEIYGPRAPAR